ncbi:hypothetical protein E8E13_008238 [Curvularia kusanoi]|uniref:RNase III domain-containing protein n=1 Tax=Curvularia kusanoi TaxID=90978 RepID=A0A9P4TGA4_CURKU|nr:hypothetical protein E8E13_008238 [Curvularia kusanoi]
MTSYDMSTEQRVARLEEIIGWVFEDQLIAVECLNHGRQPIVFNGSSTIFQKNERLAVLGDSLLDTTLITKWYSSRSDEDTALSKGQWNACIRNDLVTNERLAERGRKLGLDLCVIGDWGTANVSNGMVATTFEAAIAAIYLDSGKSLYAVESAMKKLGFFDHPLF